eukprot:2904927-Pyramimonas_sp.AAC.1
MSLCISVAEDTQAGGPASSDSGFGNLVSWGKASVAVASLALLFSFVYGSGVRRCPQVAPYLLAAAAVYCITAALMHVPVKHLFPAVFERFANAFKPASLLANLMAAASAVASGITQLAEPLRDTLGGLIHVHPGTHPGKRYRRETRASGAVRGSRV